MFYNLLTWLLIGMASQLRHIERHESLL